MAWNEPGGNSQDPWGGGNKGKNQGPPDLDDALRKLQDKLNSHLWRRPVAEGTPEVAVTAPGRLLRQGCLLVY